MHKAIRNLTRLFERIQDFEKRVVKRRGQLDRADAEAQIAALVLLARALAPFAPHDGRGAAARLGLEEAPSCRAWPESRRFRSPGSAACRARHLNDESPPIKQTRLIDARRLL